MNATMTVSAQVTRVKSFALQRNLFVRITGTRPDRSKYRRQRFIVLRHVTEMR